MGDTRPNELEKDIKALQMKRIKIQDTDSYIAVTKLIQVLEEWNKHELMVKDVRSA